ncbi:MAG TPA: M15 family metallopeptidase [Xanthomonadaceae bacterium]|nr:M15 family metallopeptidase [Xanthomonadaceae bacterium]
MRATGRTLINTPDIELWPGGLLRARANADARVLARARRVLRRKCDGRFLAADLLEGLLPLVPRLMQEAGIEMALDALEASRSPSHRSAATHAAAAATLPLGDLLPRLQLLGLDQAYGERFGLVLVPEPVALVFAGFDRYRRVLWLRSDTACAWTAMRSAAARDGIPLEAISGYRSHAYQLGIFERKRARGQNVEDILRVNAAPGYSEHHSGRALDIGTPDDPPAEESFEATPAFEWLQRHADGHGFVMSYPRDNPHGIDYEPWHWICRDE